MEAGRAAATMVHILAVIFGTTPAHLPTALKVAFLSSSSLLLAYAVLAGLCSVWVTAAFSLAGTEVSLIPSCAQISTKAVCSACWTGCNRTPQPTQSSELQYRTERKSF